MMRVLAFVPLYDPITALFPGLSAYWLCLVVPLAIAICVVYRGTRVEHLKELPKQAGIMTVQLVVVMALAAVVLAAGYWGYVQLVGPAPM
jgi:hypothetical protein